MIPELQRFTDGLCVIVGAHLTLEEAREQFGKEYDEEAEACDELWDINNGITLLKSSHKAYHEMWGR